MLLIGPAVSRRLRDGRPYADTRARLGIETEKLTHAPLGVADARHKREGQKILQHTVPTAQLCNAKTITFGKFYHIK